jgi:hypothetical protein
VALGDGDSGGRCLDCLAHDPPEAQRRSEPSPNLAARADDAEAVKKPRPAATVDEFIQSRVLPDYRDIVAMIRRAMREHAPKAEEVLTYGILGFRIRRIIAVISPTKKGITLAFSRGAEFEDKYGLLEGVGNVSKNIRLSAGDEIPKSALRYYIKQALKLEAK